MFINHVLSVPERCMLRTFVQVSIQPRFAMLNKQEKNILKGIYTDLF